jgi:hypothetical protein
LARVFIGNANLAKTARQFGGCVHVAREGIEAARKRRIARLAFASLPAPGALATDFGVGIVAKRGRECLLVTRLRTKPRNDRASARSERRGKGVMLGARRRSGSARFGEVIFLGIARIGR